LRVVNVHAESPLDRFKVNLQALGGELYAMGEPSRESIDERIKN
jgi:hypothetical protein